MFNLPSDARPKEGCLHAQALAKRLCLPEASCLSMEADAPDGGERVKRLQDESVDHAAEEAMGAAWS